MKRLSKRVKRVGLVAIAILGSLTFCIAHVNLSTRDFRFTNKESLPRDRVAIVFGAKVFRSGKPSDVLRDRLDAGVDLYKSGKVAKLLMSGDNRFVDYNEPEAMRQYAVAHGVKAEDVVADYGGRDTYDTCYRAKHIFGVDQAILITQQYHAPRAVFIARGLGIDAVAYGQPDFERYPGLMVSYSTREYMADIKAWWDVNLGHREAGVMGHPETVLARNP